MGKLYETLIQYISPKGNVMDPSDSDNINIPDFVHIDTKQGLAYLAGKKKLYFMLLNNFRKDYKDINLDGIRGKEFKLLTHSIKGLSANMGAESLYKITKELDTTQKRDLLPAFYDELKKVIDELDEKLGC